MLGDIYVGYIYLCECPVTYGALWLPPADIRNWKLCSKLAMQRFLSNETFVEHQCINNDLFLKTWGRHVDTLAPLMFDPESNIRYRTVVHVQTLTWPIVASPDVIVRKHSRNCVGNLLPETW